ncbi:MAG: metalloprotease TldD, partial [Gammaproteobacteria bacterium]
MNSTSTSVENASSLAIARETLLAPGGLDDSHLDQLFGHLLTRRLDYADLYFQAARAESWALEDGIVRSGSAHTTRGVGV